MKSPCFFFQDKPGPNATRAQREAFIINKYKEKTWVDKDVFSSQEVREHQQWSVRRLRRRARYILLTLFF